MPAQQHAHGLAAALAAAARVYLRKPSRLRREGALGACLGRRVRHALVAVCGSFGQRWGCGGWSCDGRIGGPEGGEGREGYGGDGVAETVHVLHQDIQCFCATGRAVDA
jgi:hypothetical protein